LALVGGLLRGNMALTMRIYYNSNYLLCFTCILEFLDLLRRHLFAEQNLKALEDVLDSLLEFVLVKIVGFQINIGRILYGFFEGTRVAKSSLTWFGR